MNHDAVRRLREPVAWALIVAAGLQIIAGLILLFAASSFSLQSLIEISSGNVLTGVVVAGVVALAVLLVSYGDSPSAQARLIVIAGLAVLGLAAIFGVIVWLAALGASGETIGVETSGKMAVFLYGAAKLIVIGVAGYFAFTVLQGLRPARPAAAPPGAVPPGQEGYQGYGGYPPGDQQQYGGYPPPQAPEYGQPEYGQQHGYGQQYQQPYGQPEFQQPQGQPQQGYQAQPPAEPAEGEGEAGLWTRSYGSDQQQAPGYPQSGEENDQNWYRDDRRPQ
ncbi:MAG TPA: hypothetical protein VFU43_04650 [Streptosporangiaceae bacterium]|nr:hypothetical protein [Streptosporangiaceae bacterium]